VVTGSSWRRQARYGVLAGVVTLGARIALAQAGGPTSSGVAPRDSTPLERAVMAAYQVERSGSTDLAERRYRDAIRAARQQPDSIGLAAGEYRLGLLFWSHSRQDSAVAHLRIAATLRRGQAERDPALRGEYARVLNGLGAAYYQSGLYEPAIRAYTEAQALRRSVNDSLGLARTLTNIGKTYQDWGQLDRARGKLREAIALASADRKAPAALGYAYNSLALVEIDAGAFDSARVFIARSDSAYALPKALQSRADSMDAAGNSLAARGAWLLRRGQHAAARVVLDSAYASAVARQSVRGQALALLQLGEAAFAMGQLDEADRQFTASLRLAQSVEQRVISLAAVRHLATVDEARGRTAQALAHLKQYQALRDSVFDQDAALRVAAHEAEFQIEIARKENAALQETAQAQELTISRQRWAFLGTLVVLAVVTTLVTLLVRATRAERRRSADLAQANATLAQLNEELRTTMAEVRTLSGLIPICSNCKRVRDDRGYWQAVETWVSRHSEATLSHSICQSCGPVLYGSLWTSEGESR
jgi:tetratricopeptide (TPR) repeat protein